MKTRPLTLHDSLWLLALAAAVVASFVGLLRLSTGWLWLGNYNKFTNPALLAIALLCLGLRGFLRVDGLSLVAGALVLQGVVVGLWAGGHARYFVSHAFSAVFLLVLYAVTLAWRPERDRLEGFLVLASRVLVGAYLAVMTAFWVLRLLGRNLYLGVSTGDLLIPLAFGAAGRRPLLMLTSLSMILLSGKRGVYLAALVLLFLLVPFPTRARLAPHVLLGALASGVAILLLLLSEPLIAAAPLSESEYSLVSKFFLLSPFSRDFDLGQATSGRWGELVTAFEHFESQGLAWATGLGFGWSYLNTAVTRGSETRDVVAHYVHFSPANYVLTHGVLMGSLFLALIWRVTARAYRWAMLEAGPGSPEHAVVLYAVAALVSGLTGYSYATDPFFPLTLGLLGGMPSWRTKPASGQERRDDPSRGPAVPESGPAGR